MAKVVNIEDKLAKEIKKQLSKKLPGILRDAAANVNIGNLGKISEGTITSALKKELAAHLAKDAIESLTKT
jgi:hypothetical protein